MGSNNIISWITLSTGQLLGKIMENLYLWKLLDLVRDDS